MDSLGPYEVNSIVVGDCSQVLRQIPAGVFQMAATSPPYWGQRDYGIPPVVWGGVAGCEHEWGDKLTKPTSDNYNQGFNERWGNAPGQRKQEASSYGKITQGCFCQKCGAWLGSLGLEPNVELYVEHIVEVFREVWRVLRDDGTLFLNLGDSYASGPSAPMTLSEKDVAWLACLIDGEGCIQIHRQRRPPEQNCVDSFQVDVSVGMMVDGMVKRAHAITGLGSCHQLNRGVWDWSVRGQQAATLLRAIYPALIVKKRQAALACMLAKDLAERKFGRGNRATPEAIEYRQAIKQAISDLNQRKTTTLAIIEPERVSTLGLKPKDLIGVPWMIALALRADGWYLRSDVIWHKPNCMPESVRDRPTKSHEYVFLLTKSKRYFYDQDAIREPLSYPGRIYGPSENHKTRKLSEQGNRTTGGLHDGRTTYANPAGRNKRTVWTIPTHPFPEAHFACVDEQTEILTVSGWKKHNKLAVGELVATYDTERREAVFMPCKGISQYDVQEQEMVRLRGRGIDQLLTPNHRCVIEYREGRQLIKRADELKPSHTTLVAVEQWNKAGRDFPPRLAAIIGWYVTEGSPGKGLVYIYQSGSANPEYCAEIRQLLEDEGAEFAEYRRKRMWRGRETEAVSWRITGGLANVLLAICPNKRLPRGFLGWQEKALSVLWGTLMKGDGHFRDAGRQTFVQKDKALIDQVQALATRLGYATTLRRRSTGTWSLYKTESKRRWLRSETTKLIGRESYTGMVWCPQTYYNTFIARRNGCVFITGNTFPPKLVEPMIKAGTSERGACPECGKAWVRVVERKPATSKECPKTRAAHEARGGTGKATGTVGKSGGGRIEGYAQTVGWQPACSCGLPDGFQPDDFELIDTPTGERVGDDPSMVTGRAGYNRPRGADEGSRTITRYEQRKYAEQLKNAPHRTEMEAQAGPAFEHYVRTDKSGARPVPPTLLETWLECGWLQRVEVPQWTPPNPIPCIVLDPFAGAGTALMVADRLNRDWLGIEINPEYVEMALERIGKDREKGAQLGFF